VELEPEPHLSRNFLP
jgi:hypothetical protein